MTRVKQLTVHNLRSHTKKTISFTDTTTILIGRNGAGKTSLLEAVYIALRGTSFKGSDSDVLQEKSPWWRIEIVFDDGMERIITFDPEKASAKKQFIVHGKKSARLTPKDKFPTILFEPTDLQLLQGSPTRRREYIDRLIAQVEPTYTTILSRYERALRQRNNLLKQGISDASQLFAWNLTLSDYGAKIIARRARMVSLLNEQITKQYQIIAQNADTVSIEYIHSENNSTSQQLFKKLEESIEKDRILKHTSTGPHRHDITFVFNNKPAITTTSRGEVRSILIALKYIERNIIIDTLGIEPIVLLDDVFSELDEGRQEQLTIGTGQHIITTTHVPFKAPKAQVIEIK